jgi:hypothetical protein
MEHLVIILMQKATQQLLLEKLLMQKGKIQLLLKRILMQKAI